MFKNILFTSLFFSLIIITGCKSSNNSTSFTPPEPASAATLLYQGNHELRQIGQFRSQESRSNSTFFLIAGNYSSESSTITKVTFSWLGNDGAYRFTTLPLKSLLIKINDNISVPTVKFRWTQHPTDNNEIIYAVITVRSVDWPATINVPNPGK